MLILKEGVIGGTLVPLSINYYYIIVYIVIIVMFDTGNVYHYLLAFSMIVISSYFANNVKNSFQDKDEYEMIKKYLLNDSPLYGFNKPKMWVHTKYEINARKWKSFYSRNTYDLNQPYIHLTIKTLIQNCGDNFNICLIDDDTFSKLIPNWDVDISTLAEPMKSRVREIGLLTLVYFYGGMIVPNSFVCSKNLIDLFNQGVNGVGGCFVGENQNHGVNMLKYKNRQLFGPDLFFFGAEKNNDTVKELIEYLKLRKGSYHFDSEKEFVGDTNNYLVNLLENGKINLIDGRMFGVKTEIGKPILIDDLIETEGLKVSEQAYGVFIPSEDVLNRIKYQWFAVMNGEKVISSQMNISAYLRKALYGKLIRVEKRKNVVSL
jgi:hypothetical protein